MTPEERRMIMQAEARRDAVRESRKRKRPKGLAKKPGFSIVPTPPKPGFTDPNRWSKTSDA